MIQIQQKLGKESFPLITQAFFPNHNEMTATDQYPCVLKAGHAHNGVGKVKIENASGFQEIAGLISVANSYCTVECFIDAKYDLHVQKIGTNYKAFMRKSLGGNWKTNVGQSILEETPVLDKYKTWVDAVSEMFNGLAVCSLEAVVGKDGREHIIEVNDSATLLMGESQEEDRRNIADLVFKAMEEQCLSKEEDKATPPGKEEEAPPTARPASAASSTASVKSSTPSVRRASGAAATPPVAATKTPSISRANTLGGGAAPKAPPAKPPRPTPAAIAAASIDRSNVGPSPSASSSTPPKPPQRKRHDSQDSTDSSASESSSVSGASSASSPAPKKASESSKKEDGESAPGEGPPTGPEGEDTMKNLRKTFAGIFGELS